MKISRILGPISGALLVQLLCSSAAYSQNWRPISSEQAPIPTAPMPDGIDLSAIYIKGITVNGSGCKPGNFAQNLSDDKRAFTLTFSEFFAQIGPGINPNEKRRNCNVTLKLNVPAGYQYTVGTFNYRGHMTLDAGVRAEVKTNYFFSGLSAQGTYAQSRVGELDEDYVFTDAVGFTTAYVPGNWSPCNIERPFSINSTVSLSRTDGNPNSQGLITNESVDGEFVQQFGIAYRRCGSTTPPNPTPPTPPTPPDPGPNPNNPDQPNNPGPSDPSPTNGLENGKIYSIVSRYSGQCLDVRDHALHSGAPLQQWSCTGEPHQKFKALYQRNGSWYLVGVQSGKYVSVENGWIDNGNGIFQYDLNNSEYQHIVIDRSPEGFHKMKFRHSNKCLDIDGPNYAPGTRAHQWDCQAGQQSQDWLFVADRTAPQPEVLYEIVNRKSNKCFDVFNHGTVNGVKLQQWSCTNEPHQWFRLVSHGHGNYQLVGHQSGKTVTVRDWANWNGAEFVIWDDQWGANQRLILTPSLNGAYQLRFSHSNKCLDLDSGSLNDGAKVQQWDCQLTNPHQDWILRRR